MRWRGDPEAEPSALSFRCAAPAALSDRCRFVNCVREYCYFRGEKYACYGDPNDFAYVIHAEENASELVRRALSRAPVDLLMTVDYQPAECIFGLSLKMLQVCSGVCSGPSSALALLERSPLVLRDLELLQDANDRARAIVYFGIVSAPDSRTTSVRGT